MISRALLVLVLLFVLGCGSKLRPDTFPASIASGYPTAELRAAGKLWNGLAVVSIRKGEPLSSLDLSVQGYYQGTVRATSEACGIDLSRQYQNSELISLPAIGRAQKSCLIAVTINPLYPKQENQDLVVRGFRGYISVTVTDGSEWVGDAIKVSGSWSRKLKKFIGGSGQVRVVMDGCGKAFDKQLDLDSKGYVEIPVNEAVQKSAPGACALAGVVISPQFKNLLFKVLVAVYKTDYVPLPIPIVKLEGKTLEVQGTSEVSIVALDNVLTISDKFKTKEFDASKPQVLRLLTVQGRFILGEWSAAKGWTWKQ